MLCRIQSQFLPPAGIPDRLRSGVVIAIDRITRSTKKHRIVNLQCVVDEEGTWGSQEVHVGQLKDPYPRTPACQAAEWSLCHKL